MVVTQKYNVIDLDKGTLDRRIFTDGQVYQEELEQVFGRAWLMIGHESLVPNANDFFLSYMGEDPVILTRDSKDQIHVFLNMCRHRGNRIVRADDGNAKNFMCTYHGWTFSNEGKLVSVPGLQEAYYGELDVERLGLVEARSETYAGIVFATWAEDAPTLEAYLGDLRWYMDIIHNHRDCGIQAVGPIKWIAPFNWKTPVDNAPDFYHARITHQSVGLARARVQSPRMNATVGGSQRPFQSPRRQISVNGHVAVATVLDKPDGLGWNTVFKTAVTPDNRSKWEAFHQSILPEVERRVGSFRARRMEASARIIFPNVFIGLRIAHPRGPLKSELWSFVYYDKDSPEEVVRAKRLRMGQEDQLGGVVEQDDMDNWRQMTDSGLSTAGRKYPHDLSMGVGHMGNDPLLRGRSIAERFISENAQRAYYARWQEFMNAKSWAGIHIDPVTAPFEGTATMKG